MKSRNYITSLAVLAILLAGVGTLAWLAFQPDARAPKLAVVLLPREPVPTPATPAPTPRKTAKVDLRRAGPPSAAAMREIDAGKFIVRTEFLDERQKEELYRQLRLRGGVFVVEDERRHPWLLPSPSERLPLAKAGIPLDTYALNRPRALPASEAHYTGGYAARPGEQLFLVMPKDFEARVLTEIEHVLPEPLANYNFAHLTLELTANGYLEFNLTEVANRQHGLSPLSGRFRGL